jgi:hypothetical protein
VGLIREQKSITGMQPRQFLLQLITADRMVFLAICQRALGDVPNPVYEEAASQQPFIYSWDREQLDRVSLSVAP